MEAVSRYKRLINDIGAVFSLFLSYKNTDHTHYKQLVKNWGVGEVCSLLSEVEAFSVEELKHELYSLDGKPLKRFIDDLWCYLPDYNKELYCLAQDKEIFSLLEDIHGGKNAHLIIDNLIAIGITATKTKINRVALILDELQPQRQTQESSSGRELPSELDTEQARKYFERAVVAGLMTKQYKWLKSQILLACFAREMSLKLCLNKAQNDDGTFRISWQPFEMLFGYPKYSLRTSYNEIKKTGDNPKEIEKVDEIFKD